MDMIVLLDSVNLGSKMPEKSFKNCLKIISYILDLDQYLTLKKTRTLAYRYLLNIGIRMKSLFKKSVVSALVRAIAGCLVFDAGRDYVGPDRIEFAASPQDLLPGCTKT